MAQADLVASKIKKLHAATQLDQQLASANGLQRLALSIRRHFLPYYFMAPPFWRILLRNAQSKKRAQPDFFSIGAVRSGTTLLSDYIMQHPNVVLPLAKEIAIKTSPTMSLIKAQLPTLKEMEASASTLGKAITGYCSPVVPSMLFPSLAPNLNASGKVIFIMRNPVYRTFSHWRWDQLFMERVGKDALWKNFPDFDELIDKELELSRYAATTGFTIAGSGVGGYLQHSNYVGFTKLLLEQFSKEQVLFLNADEFFSDAITTSRRVYQFLDLPDYKPAAMTVRNAGPPGTIKPQTRDRLIEFFKPLNEQLYELIKMDMGW